MTKPVLLYLIHITIILIVYHEPQIQNESTQAIEQPSRKMLPKMLSKEEEMELFAIQNDCVRVKEDFVNGGYVCDDFE